MTVKTKRSDDVVAWAREQASYLRARRFADLDVEALAEEIDDVGKSEERELASRMAVLLAHLLKWQFQSERRSNSWRRTIAVQRAGILRRLKRTPSLKVVLDDADWLQDAWDDALQLAAAETGLDIATLPERCTWPVGDVIRENWLP